MTEHCCEAMRQHVFNQEVHINYVPSVRSYGVEYKREYGGGWQDIYYCPWCGSKLPQDLSEKRWEIAIEELGYEDFDDPQLPDEFKTDEWWKKRGL